MPPSSEDAVSGGALGAAGRGRCLLLLCIIALIDGWQSTHPHRTHYWPAARPWPAAPIALAPKVRYRLAERAGMMVGLVQALWPAAGPSDSPARCRPPPLLPAGRLQAACTTHRPRSTLAPSGCSGPHWIGGGHGGAGQPSSSSRDRAGGAGWRSSALALPGRGAGRSVSALLAGHMDKLAACSFAPAGATGSPHACDRLPHPLPHRSLARLEAARAALAPLPRDALGEVIEELSHSTALLDRVRRDLDSIHGRLRRTRAQLAAAYPRHAVAPPHMPHADAHAGGAAELPGRQQQEQAQQQQQQEGRQARLRGLPGGAEQQERHKEQQAVAKPSPDKTRAGAEGEQKSGTNADG